MKATHFIGLLIVLTGYAYCADPSSYTVDLQTILTHDDGEFLWFHPRAAVNPGDDGRVVMTLQKHLHKSDFYSGIYVMQSRDSGKTWTDPVLPKPLDWVKESDDVVVAVCDVTPGWHAPSGKLLALGAKVRYRDGEQLYDTPQSRAGAYAVYNPKDDTWSPWKFIDVPDPGGAFALVTVGCSQWCVEDDGSVLVPIYFQEQGATVHHVTVLRCGFDGETLSYKEHGTVLTLDVERGLVEPSLIRVGGTYYLTLRNDERAYVTRGTDGIHFDPIIPWTFDDGGELGSYNTQQHWATHGDKLYLVYTRRGAENDHIMRNRAPLFMAEVNRENLRVIRETEKVIVPERGATLGNFGVNAINPNETWVTVSEGVWNDDARSRGATGATFVARILWEDTK